MGRVHKTAWPFVLALLPALVGLPPAPADSARRSAETPSGEIGLTATFDRTSVTIGDLVTLNLHYVLPQGAVFPKDAAIKGLDALTVVKRVQVPESIAVTVLADKLGTLATGPIAISYVDKNGKLQTLTTDPVSIKVSSVVQADASGDSLRPIKDIVVIRPIWLSYAPWAAGAIAVLIVLAGILWWSRRRRIQPLSAEKIDPPHVAAERALQGLVARRLFEKGHIKTFYFSFSEILRRYLGDIRKFPAVELTTEEIAHRIREDEDRTLVQLLRTVDLVKFADLIPSPARQKEHVGQALDYIRRTAPIPETPASPSAGSTTERVGS